jgi:deaminated glutathione amidase
MSLLAIAQFAPGDDRDRNLGVIDQFATEAAGRGATLVVFPEYSSFFEAELGDASVAAAEHLDGEFVAGLGAIAVRLGIHVVAGMLEKAGEKVSNTVVAVDPAGAVIATYRKLHLYDAFGQRESDRVRAGEIEEPQTFGWQGFTVGLQTCYDIRFPEVTRRLVDAGADLVLVPAEWVRGPLKEHHWRVLVTARAIENTVYVAAADHAPPIGAGNSMVVDPMGVELVTIGDETGIAVADLTPGRVASVRETNPALRLRRFGVHQI